MAEVERRTGKTRRQRANPDVQLDAETAVREVILVDDAAELRETIRFGLESSGYLVTTFGSGPEAFEALLALPQNAPVRLLLLAIDLPGMDGHTLHEQLQLARPQGFIVVFLSTRHSDADQVRALTAGAVDYLFKPVSIPVLIEKVEVWFRMCNNRL